MEGVTFIIGNDNTASRQMPASPRPPCQWVTAIYRDAYVAVDDEVGSFNLRHLMPGESTWIQIPCQATESSRPSIWCEHLVPGQKIEYQASVQ